MPQTGRTFRVFISSTFDDLKAERNALQQRVFPRLRQTCAAHGARFQAIDLRWGISEEAAYDQQTMQICLREIDRCKKVSPRPNFVVLLGDRYGWRPLPAEIPDAEFAQLLRGIDSQADKDVVKEWYLQDTNGVPAVWWLKPRSGSWQRPERWEEIETRLHTILKHAAESLDVAARSRYIASATMQEVESGAMGPADAKQHVFAFFRSIQDSDTGKANARFVEQDPELRDRLAALKKKLRDKLGDNVHDYEATWRDQDSDSPISLDHLDKLCEEVYRSLESVILRELGEMGEQDPLLLEIDAHSSFASERTQFFVGRDDALDSAAHYLADDSRQAPFVFIGASGSGKSALMAQAIDNTIQSNASATLLFRFIGVTPGSSNGRELLESLCDQLGRTFGITESLVGLDDLEVAAVFQKRLELASNENPIVIFLDAVDQLRDGDPARDLSWLPVELPRHARIIVSSLPEGTGATLRARNTEDGIFELEPMPLEQGGQLLDLWLSGAKRSLTAQQRDAVLESFRRSGLPLFLKLLFEDARLWRSTDGVPEVPNDVPAVVRRLFERLSMRSNHGPVLVSRALGYLAAAKEGLAEDEILDLLANDADVFDDFAANSHHDLPWEAVEQRRIPAIVWSRLQLDLEPYLSQHRVDNTSLLVFFHRQLQQIAKDLYLNQDDGLRCHRNMASYFARQWQAGNSHALAELPFQQQSARQWSDLCTTLCDVDFMQTKIDRLSAPRLMDDFTRAIELTSADLKVMPAIDPKGLAQIRDAIRLSLTVVSDDAAQLRSQLIGRLRQLQNPTVKSVVAGCLATTSQPWIRPLSKNLSGVGQGQMRRIDAYQSAVLSMAVSATCERAITTSMEPTIKLWRLGTGEEIQRLHGHADRVDSVAVDAGWRRVVSASSLGTFKFWDLRTGLETFTCDLAGGIECLCITSDGTRAVVANGSQLTVWHIADSKQLVSLPLGESGINAMCITADDRYVITVSFGGTLCRWDIDTGEGEVLFEDSRHYRCIASTPDANRVAIASTDEVLIWDRANREIVHVLEGHDKAIWALALSSDGRTAFSGGVEGDIKVWDLDSGTLKRLLRGHTSNISALHVAEDSNSLVSASADGTIRIWDLASTDDDRQVHNGELHAVAVSAELGVGISASCDEKIDPKHILDRVSSSPSVDHILKVWDLSTGQFIRDLSGHEAHPARGSGICELAVVGDGNCLLSGGADGTLRLWSLESGDLLHTLSGFVGSVKLFGASADGQRIVFGISNDLLVWDLAAESGFEVSPAHSSSVSALAVSPGGRLAVSASYDQLLKVWDLEARQLIFELGGHTDSIPSIALTEDFQFAVSGSRDGTVRVWDLNAGQEMHRLIGHEHWITSVDIDPGGTVAASGAWDNTVRLWNPMTGQSLAVLEGHRGTVTDVRIAGNRKNVWSVSEDHTVKVWDSSRGQCIATYTAEGPLEKIAIAPDETAIVAEGDSSGLVHIIQLTSNEAH